MKKLLTFFILFPIFIQAQHWKVLTPAQDLLVRVEQSQQSDSTYLNGKFEVVYLNKLTAKGQYLAGKRTGTWQQFYPNGTVFIHATYHKGNKEGEWNYYYENGQPKATIFFVENTPAKIWQSYHANGKQWATVYYSAPGKPAEVIIKDTSGVVVKHRLYHYQKRSISQVDSTFYTNGVLKNYAEYENNCLDGPYKTYYLNGELQEELVYDNNKLLEVRCVYSENKKQLPTGTLFNGTGSRYGYTPNGTKIYELHYKNGQLHSKQLHYHANGQLLMESYFNNGVHVGIEKYYNANGVMKGATEYDYKNNKIIVTKGKSLTFGHRKIIAYDTNWMLNGPSKELDIVGNVVHETPFFFGLKHGKERYYHSAALSIEHEINYAFGDKVESEKWFNPSKKVVYSIQYPTFKDEVILDSSWANPKLFNSTIYRNSIEDLMKVQDFYKNNVELMSNMLGENKGEFTSQIFGAIRIIDEHGQSPFVNSSHRTNHQKLTAFENELNQFYKEQEYLINFKVSRMRYKGELAGYIKSNLMLENNLHQFNNSGINALFSIFVDEFGYCLTSEQHKTDIFKVADGIQQLLKTSPLFVPATICGLPVVHRSTILYTY